MRVWVYELHQRGLFQGEQDEDDRFDQSCRGMAPAVARKSRLQRSRRFRTRVSEESRAKAARIAEGLKLALFYRPDRSWPAESKR